MPCSEKACPLPAAPGSALCRHHARMFDDPAWFQSNGSRVIEAESQHEIRLRQKRGYAANRAAREGRQFIERPRRLDAR